MSSTRRSISIIFAILLVSPLMTATVSRAQSNSDTATTISSPSEQQGYEDPFATQPEQDVNLSDPFQPFNEAMFEFNDAAYENVLGPTGEAYQEVVGRTIRKGIRNVFRNLDEPRNLVNSLLQGRPEDAQVALSRFLINSTAGIGGFFDMASPHFKPRRRRLDQTLAKWGVPPGPYIVWPIYGSSTPRATFGEVVDGFLYPPYYLEGEDAARVQLGLTVGRNFNELSFQLGRYEEFKNMAVDPYAGLKNAYEQRLEEQLAD
jgi:phospholipid-binding lipoprotein MlaA